MAETVTSGMILRRRLVFLAPLAVFGVLAGYFVWGLNPDRNPRDLPSAMIDQAVPEFSLPPIEGMDGQGLSAADLRTGEVTLVNFFASWCVPCRLEHRYLLELAKDDKVHLYGVNYKNKPEEARAWLAELGNPYGRIGVDATGRVGIDWGVYGVPETYIIDRAGRVRYRQLGPIDQHALDETIRPMIRALSQ